MSASPWPDILCVGEVLWDVYPSERHLGGAPLNVAAHLRSLGASSAIVSRVGDDVLGREILTRLDALDLPAAFVQVDSHLPTGVVTVDISEPSAPKYTIEEPAAWDNIEATPFLLEAAEHAHALVFGSLAQRRQPSRNSIRTLARFEGLLRVFDVNLRPPYDDREIVDECLGLADLVKLNDVELATLRSWFGLPTGEHNACEEIRDRFGCQSVCVTRGANGAAILHGNEWLEHPGYRVAVLDAVGAGDAFLAALLAGILQESPAAKLLTRANAVGAFVATQRGATPRLDEAAVRRIMSSL